jgi:uncharacterized protein YdhG (YjbR/CyaY superfamily)
MEAIRTMDEYIDLQENELKSALIEIRTFIKSIIPEAEECISYQIPSFKYRGMFVGFGSRKNGISFYFMNANLFTIFKEELSGYKGTKSALHLEIDKPLPTQLLEELIKYRINENNERFTKKQLKKNEKK